MVVSEFVQSVRPLMQKFGIDAPDIRIQAMTLDSRDVSSHVAFVAVKGHSLDGRDFIPQAISLGTPIIFVQADSEQEHGQITMRDHTVLIYLYALPDILSSIAGAFYDYPANKLITTAVTGTNGKTSVVNLISQLKFTLGTRSAAIGTLGSAIYEGPQTDWAESKNANTTPDAIYMQYQLAEFVQQGVAHVAFEASSHALVQGRLAQIKTDVAVFTNLSRDHLDYHGTMEEYAAAKRLLLDQPSVRAAVINGDDHWSKAWIEGAKERGIKTVITGLRSTSEVFEEYQHYCFASDIQYHTNGVIFILHTSWGKAQVKCALLGEFNVYNLLSAVATLLVQGERFSEVIKGIAEVKPVAGRMEVFEFSRAANVVVDYAHTPDALEKALQAVRKHTGAKCWCIFGCGGDRDKGKRPQMATVAEKFADRVVLTTDNARSEDPQTIVADIMKGFDDAAVVGNQPDREQALRYCLNNASPQDLILAAGKGHEAYQIINNHTLDYDERAVIARLQQEYSS
ncbi:UDP-N-acetylmuramoyl-L-alanyl-D-glutamate--2,6-diaminopimelate ligase [Alteromonas sediminis]|uniref:UDP-N-acetylmuramyl-tripeptide synthetase n=1 Tax=Alteromonas sediminis TaxID=2259342 RepID=A0A3N5YPV3_9ALTE|nr:UDP-N-acetylmuramoyl-L-alanyl-D-glutamate--2,6-diaminopimelate ligase [Alteromonas sediminis]RPJ67941.1 UDP-N-acetylmuramoyl-L-alanyl-D-glutamate--2,6-diaminopimelate ligase [Alteromonas sediminis]